ncbi:MAG TPA: polyprenol monophosphomannose synthase [Vicinamibacterales bacterium]|nr:polyprenol monophosphomannose synthase [Vicinamibacterales bacterium]
MTIETAAAPGAARVLVVVPTYNERGTLPELLSGITAHDRFDVLVVDDASPDGTGAIADAWAARMPGRVDVLHREGARGLGRAYADGLARALERGAPVIVQMDADLSHDPQYLPDLVEALDGADLAIGSRYLNGISVVNWPLRRIALSTFANRYIRAVTGLTARDCTSGYRCWRRETLARVPLTGLASNGYAFLTEMLFHAAKNGARIVERPIVFVERREGVSKLDGRVLAESVLTPLRLAASRGRIRNAQARASSKFPGGRT